MHCVESAETALQAVGSATSEHARHLALAQLRADTFEVYRVLAEDLEVCKQRQNRLNSLRQQTLRLTRAKAQHRADIERLQSFAGTDAEDSEAGTGEPRPKRMIGLFSEFGIEATENDAKETIQEEFEARRAAAVRTAHLEWRVQQLDAALKRLREFLASKWPRVRERYDEMVENTLKLENVYAEVNEEVNMARNGSGSVKFADSRPRPRKRTRGRRRLEDSDTRDHEIRFDSRSKRRRKW